MSGWDVQLRSDALTMPLRQRGAEMEADAMAGIGQTAMDTVRYIQESQRENAESDARLRLWETDRQIKLRQLQEMQALDATEMARLQTLGAQQSLEAQRLQIDQARHQYEQQQRMSSQITDEMMKQAWLNEQAAKLGVDTPENAALQGRVFKPGPGGMLIAQEDPEGAKRYLEDAARFKRDSRHPPYGGGLDPQSRAATQLEKLRRSAAALREADKIEEAEAVEELMAETARGMTGGAAPEPKAPTSPRAGDGARSTAALAFANHPALKWTEDPRLKAMAPGGVPDEGILNSLAQMAEQLEKDGYSPADAQEWVARNVMNNPGWVAKLLVDAGYRDEQLEMYLRALGLDDAQIGRIIKAVR